MVNNLLLLLTMCFLALGCGTAAPRGSFESDDIGTSPAIETVALHELEVAPEAGNEFPRLYTIRKGDTLSQISTTFYGTFKHWQKIVDANPGLEPRKLKIGQNIILPKIDR